jgi:hypothetical protein
VNCKVKILISHGGGNGGGVITGGGGTDGTKI